MQSTTDSLSAAMAIIRSWSAGSPSVTVPEIDTINVVIGDGVNVLATGIAIALRVDFNATITSGFLHEFDGTSGSVTVSIDKAAYVAGLPPSFSSIVGSSPLVISSARYGENLTLTGWTTLIRRGDVLRFSVSSASSIKRLLVALRIRRLEP